MTDASFPIPIQVEGTSGTGDVDCDQGVNAQARIVYVQRIKEINTDIIKRIQEEVYLNSLVDYHQNITFATIMNRDLQGTEGFA